MNAVIDIGNTFSKIAFFNSTELISFEKGIRIKSVIDKLNNVNPEALIVCSVTRSPTELELLFEEFNSKIILHQETPTPITNLYQTPATLGYDRLAAAAGANYHFPNTNCLIIDFGTAIKYDYVTSKGEFIGGIISPGLRMRFKALHTFTKKLPLLSAAGYPELIGNSTNSCIQSGVINGAIAEINGIIERYQQTGTLQIIITGGDAGFFESRINYPKFDAPYLVVEGLNRILNYNVENKILSL